MCPTSHVPCRPLLRLVHGVDEYPGEHGEDDAGPDLEDDEVEEDVKPVEQELLPLCQLAVVHRVDGDVAEAVVGLDRLLQDGGRQVVRDAQNDRANCEER